MSVQYSIDQTVTFDLGVFRIKKVFNVFNSECKYLVMNETKNINQ